MLSITLRAATLLSVLFLCLVSANDLDADQVSDTSAKNEDSICNNALTTFTVTVGGEKRTIPYAVINGRAIVEGDIDIGPAEEIPKGGASYAPPVIPAFVNGKPTRWPNNTVPYTIDPALNGTQRVKIDAAIAEWRTKTAVRFEKIDWSTRDWRRYDYVKFTDKKDNACVSNTVGKKQKDSKHESVENENINTVNISGCELPGNIVHEIGHVVGLFHEQSRNDRDQYVTVLWSNIEDAAGTDRDSNRRQFCKAFHYGGSEIPGTAYDYESIMHYGVYGFGKSKENCTTPPDEDGRCPTLKPDAEKLKQKKVPLVRVGQRERLSKGDIEVINTLYPPKEPPQPGTQPSCETTTATVTTHHRGTTTTVTTTTQRCPGGGQPPPPFPKPPHDRPHRCCYPEAYCYPLNRCCCSRGTDWCYPRVHIPRPPWNTFPHRLSHGRWWGPDFWEGGDFDDWDD